jgi:hypothetical protein
VLFAAFGSAVRAVPFPCGAHDNPAGCEAVFGQGQELAIRPGLPFVWLRKSPSSSGEIAGTLVYSSAPSMTVVQGLSTFDGYQNWWLVALLSNPSLKGWVEQDSLVDPINPTSAPPAQWTTPFTATIRSGLPFAWIRSDAYSSASVLATLLPGDSFTVLNPASDNDHWWYIRATTSAGTKEGYIEQGSIVPTTAASTNGNAPRPACDAFSVSPGTFKPPVDNPEPEVDIPASYQVSPNSTITFRVTGLQNVASVTFYLPGMDEMGWTNAEQPRRVTSPGTSAEVQLAVPSGGYTIIWVDAVGVNGETIQCGSRVVVTTFSIGS